MTVSWWAFTILCLAAFRLWKLADDRILDRPRDWLLDSVVGHRGEQSGIYWSDFLRCPWCAGFWISFATYVVAMIGPLDWEGEWIGAALSVLAISAVVGLLGAIYFAISGE